MFLTSVSCAAGGLTAISGGKFNRLLTKTTRSGISGLATDRCSV